MCPLSFSADGSIEVRRVSDCLTSVRPSRGVCGPQSDVSTSEQGKNGATLAAPSPISTGESTLPLLTRCKCRVLPFWPSTSTRSHLIKLNGIDANILTHNSLYSMAAQQSNGNPAVNSPATDTTPISGRSNCQILFLSHASKSTIG